MKKNTIKKMLAVLLALSVLFVLVACKKSEKPAPDAGTPNPMTEITADELEFSVNVPEGASDVKYFTIEEDGNKINQMSYTVDGSEYCYRMQSTGETAAYDMSGIFAEDWETEDAAVSYCDAFYKTCSEGSVIYWLDVVPGVNYTLSCADKLSAEELEDAAALLFVPMQGEAEIDDVEEEIPAIAEGHYENDNFDTVDLVCGEEEGTYDVSIGLYRLASLEGEGVWEEGCVMITIEAPDGESTISGRFFPEVEGEGYSLCFTDSQWELLESGSLFEGFVPGE